MHGRRLLAPAVAVAALAVAATPAAAKTVNLTIKDTNEVVKVDTGDTIRVSLPSNQTTPYHWKITKRPKTSVARVTRNRYIQGGSGMPGAGGKQIYVLKATGAGATGFQAQYQEISTGKAGGGNSQFVLAIQVS